MAHLSDLIRRHYARGSIINRIERAFAQSGLTPKTVMPADLASIDEFHVRGRLATEELANRIVYPPAPRILDIGCGLGGAARYLANTTNGQVVGIDLTLDYLEAASLLTTWTGNAPNISFVNADATRLPVLSESFDVAWTQHAQMNVASKPGFYGEIARILRPGGQLAFHDIFRRGSRAPFFPLPWADDPSLSFLASPDATRELLERLDFEVLHWEDQTRQSLQWFEARLNGVRERRPSRLGLHLLMGDTAREKLENLVESLARDRLAVVQGLARKR